METENPADVAHLQGHRRPSGFCGVAGGNNTSSSSAVFGDRPGDFPAAYHQRLLLPGSSSVLEDSFINQLVSNLGSSSIDEQRSAAMEIRLLAKNNPENRLQLAQAGAIEPLVSIVSSSGDPLLQENGVTAILNLSICDDNKAAIAAAGAISPLVRALEAGTSAAKENAACALLRLSETEQSKVEIGRAGAIPPLVSLLECGGERGKKDAATALYSLCSLRENKVRAVEAGLMRPLVGLMAAAEEDVESSMVDKAVFVAGVLVNGVEEGRAALVAEGGIPVLVEILEVGSQRQKEVAVAILLQLCEGSDAHRAMVAREGAVPALVAMSQTGSSCARQKVRKLIDLLRQTRSKDDAAGRSESPSSSILERSSP